VTGGANCRKAVRIICTAFTVGFAGQAFERGILGLYWLRNQLVTWWMHKRKSFNPKRKICAKEAIDPAFMRALIKKLHYGGNPEHKRNPGDFGLDPPISPRVGKTLCDDIKVFKRSEGLKLLREGFAKGMVSVQKRGAWPQNVWAVTKNGEPVEAQLEGEGMYHRYPMAHNDPFRCEVLTRWDTR